MADKDTPKPTAEAQPDREFKTWPPVSQLDEYRRELKRLHRAGERVEFSPHPVHVDAVLATFESESPERLHLFKEATDSLTRQANKFKGERDYRAFYADLTSHSGLLCVSFSFLHCFS
jgi:hypothetical protein